MSEADVALTVLFFAVWASVFAIHYYLKRHIDD